MVKDEVAPTVPVLLLAVAALVVLAALLLGARKPGKRCIFFSMERTCRPAPARLACVRAGWRRSTKWA